MTVKNSEKRVHISILPYTWEYPNISNLGDFDGVSLEHGRTLHVQYRGLMGALSQMSPYHFIWSCSGHWAVCRMEEQLQYIAGV